MNGRFIYATNKDLKDEIEKGKFRHDLYFRISAFTIQIPPLRERREDIPLLIEHFNNGIPDFRGKRFSENALGALSAYTWPGNVRELQNVLYRILLLSNSRFIDMDALPADIIHGQKTGGRRIEEVEKDHILKILKETGGKKKIAAEILGIDPKTLFRKLKHCEKRENGKDR